MMLEGVDHDHLFVDEAGDPVLFNKRGRVIVGTPGVSRVFMVGAVRLPEPQSAQKLLDDLRISLLADPYFARVPSMLPEARKTAFCFHAKDDLPEVRREVFKLLPTLKATVQVAIRRKSDLAIEAQVLHKRGYRLTADMIYDDLVNRLFQGLLTPAKSSVIAFARRGKSDRLHALMQAIRHATSADDSPTAQGASPALTTVYADQPNHSAGLQIADYYIWAVQRLFERNEDRFYQLLAADYRSIMDLDDQRNQPGGEWYTQKNPLMLAKIKPVAG